jgi:hypothetical protein
VSHVKVQVSRGEGVIRVLQVCRVCVFVCVCVCVCRGLSVHREGAICVVA